jgi:hypothetical protein
MLSEAGERMGGMGWMDLVVLDFGFAILDFGFGDGRETAEAVGGFTGFAIHLAEARC